MEPVEIDITLNSNVAEEGSKATTAIEELAQASLHARAETKKSLELQRDYLAKLRSEYQSVQKQLAQMKFPTKEKNELQRASNALAKELADEEQGLKRLEAEWAKMNRGYSDVQHRMRQTREQMKLLSLAGKENTAEYAKLRHELGELAEAQALITRTQTEMAKGNQAWRGLADAVSAFSGAASAALGAWTLLGGSQEEQAKIQTKLQSLMAITIGLQQVQNVLLETSTFRIQTVTRAKKLWATANIRLASALRISTTSAKALTGTLTLGLSVAIGWLINLYDKWQSKQRKVREEQEAFHSSVASKVSASLAKFEALRQQFTSLNGDLKAQRKFVKENADAFRQLGVQVDSVQDAENLFVQNAEAFVQSLMLRAKATASMELASEKYKESIQKMLDAEKRATNISWGDKFKAFLSNLGLARMGRGMTATGAGFAEEAGAKLAEGGERLQEEAEAIISNGLDFEEEWKAIWERVGITPRKAGGSKGVEERTNAIRRALERLSKLTADAEREGQEIALAVMQEGRAKRLAELETEYNARKALIAQKLAEIAEMEQSLGVDGSEARNRLTKLQEEVEGKYAYDVEQAKRDYADIILGIEQEITSSQATDLERRLADVDNHYTQLLDKARGASESEVQLQELTNRLLEAQQRERELITRESELRALDSEERIAVRRAQFSAKQYNLQAEREEELLQLQLDYSKKRLAKLQEIASAGGEASEAISEAKAEIEGLKTALEQIPEKKLRELGSGLKSIFSNLASIGGELGATFSELGKGVDNIMTAFSKSATPLDRIGGAIGGLTQLLNIATETAEQNQEALKAWESASMQALQVARMQRIEAEGYKGGNIWGVENPYARAIAGAKQYAQSMKELNQLAHTLGRGQIQTGTKKVVSGRNVAGGLAGGAAVGAAIGSFIPAIGNAVGAVVGGIFGGIFGATRKKVVPVFESLAKKYGEIFNRDTFALNPRILQDYNKLDEATRKLVDNWDAVQKKAKEAQEEMRNTFKELSGNLGQQLSNALVEGFKNDNLYSALEDFDRKVSEMIHGIVQQLVFSQYFQQYFDELQERMKASFSAGGDGSIVDDIIWFSRVYRNSVSAYSEEMKKAQEELRRQGFEAPWLEELSGRKAVAKGIARADQESIDDLNGRMTVVVDRLNTLVNYRREAQAHEADVRQFQLTLLKQVDRIAEHTEFLRRLEGIERDIANISQEGIRLKR